MKELKFIAIEGVIGAGKTTLAKAMAERLHAGVILEEFEENPFLAKFYSNPGQYAFHTQIYFLLSRYRQQGQIAQTDLFASRIITDYLFAKDRIFAEVNLREDEFALYDRIYGLVEKDVPKPDLVIYLQVSSEVLYKRIKQRNRLIERDVNFDYIDALVNAYNAFFIHYNTAPLLIVAAEGFDFVGDSRDLDLIVDAVARTRTPRMVLSKS